jgi:hypothetical protein
MEHAWILGQRDGDVRFPEAVRVRSAFVPSGIVLVGYEQGRRQILQALCVNRRDIGVLLIGQ